MSQSQQQTQATDNQEEEIKKSINFPYVEGTSEKLRRILRSHKIRSTLYTENTLREIDCSNCEAVYFGESKQSLNHVQMNTKHIFKSLFQLSFFKIHLFSITNFLRPRWNTCPLGYLSFKTLLACLRESFRFSIKSIIPFSSNDSILM